MKYEGKRVVIVGGTSGFGFTVAKRLTSEGGRVIVTGRKREQLDKAAVELGERAVVVRSDIASLAELDALADRVEKEFGTIDAVFVNAGVAKMAPLAEVREEDFDELFAINAKGPYFTVQKLAPLLNEGGAVVLTTSVANVRGVPMMSGYAATKAALRSMARSFATELLPRKIRVNAVSPGPIDTGILDRSLPPEVAEPAKAQMTADNPMSRFGAPEEVATAMLFLAFDATYTTGAELPVDGGVSQL
ncbi:SDR family oxidoreductase [Amycolatopsis sp. NPDC054798]